MIINGKGGHSPNCLGTVALRNEYEQMQILFNKFKSIMESYGHTVYDCNSNLGYLEELYEGVRKANKHQDADLFISFHMNASENKNGNGTEAWIYPGSSSKTIAQRLVNNYATLGFQNRGVKDFVRYYETYNAKMPAIIFETCFCDNQSDIDKWSPVSWEKLARLICNAIDPNIPIEESQPEAPKLNTEDPTGNVRIVTQYLPTGYMGKPNTSFKGIDVKHVDSYMCGVRWELIPNSYGQWAETELLDPQTAIKVRESLGNWFCEFRTNNK